MGKWIPFKKSHLEGAEVMPARCMCHGCVLFLMLAAHGVSVGSGAASAAAYGVLEPAYDGGARKH